MGEWLNDGLQLQAVDTTAEGIRGARRQLDELQKPGPRAPFQSTPLTSLDPNPFENRPGPKASDEKQVPTGARSREGCESQMLHNGLLVLCHLACPAHVQKPEAAA